MNGMRSFAVVLIGACALTTTGCHISRIVYRPGVFLPSFPDRRGYDVILAGDFIQPPDQPQTSESGKEKKKESEAPPDADKDKQNERETERKNEPAYTVPGPQYRQLAALAVGVAAFGISDVSGSGKEAAESQFSGTPISVVGRPGLGAPPPRVNSAIVGRPGLQQGFAAGLGPASDRNIFTARTNALSGPNGRCQDLVRAGFFGGNRAACEANFRR